VFKVVDFFLLCFFYIYSDRLYFDQSDVSTVPSVPSSIGTLLPPPDH